MTAKLSVLVTCKNEIQNIGPCVDAIRGLAADIVVGDSGSTDGTLELVRSWSDCRVIEREYVCAGDFKNWAIPHCQHDWVLVLDADERVTPELAAEIRGVLARPTQDGYWIYRLNHFMGHPVRHGPWGNDCVLRLFRRSVAAYVGDTDHAEVQVRTGRVGRLRNRMTHYTFWTYAQYLRKIERYATIQSGRWIDAGRRPSLAKLLLNVPLRFLQTYLVRGGFRDGAVGLQVCMMVAFYSFLKQGYLWERARGLAAPRDEVPPAVTASSTVLREAA